MDLSQTEILQTMKEVLVLEKVPVQLVCEEDNLLYDKIPDHESLRKFRAMVKDIQLDEFVKRLHQNSIEMSDLEFFKLKNLQGEPFQYDPLFLKATTDVESKPPAKEKHLQAPKFGMPTELFKDCIKKDDRVPKLTDKRIL